MRDRERYLDSGGVRLRARESGDGPALILIHGWALDADMWEPQLIALSRDYRVIAYDRRGFGLSSGEPNIEMDVADLRTIFERHDIRAACVVGMSQGARVALRFAQRHPTLVTSLVLDGPPANVETEGDSASEIPMARYRELIARHGLAAFRREWRQHALIQLRTSDAATRSLLRAMIERYPGKDLIVNPPENMQAPVVWSAIRVPVLIVNGAEDSTERHAAGEAVVRAIEGARRVAVPHAAHLPNLDNPSSYNESLRAFLREHASP